MVRVEGTSNTVYRNHELSLFLGLPPTLIMNRFLFLFLLSPLFWSCQNNAGEKLAKQHCSSCHQFTPPEMLDKKTWKKSVLPEMAFRMGLIHLGTNNKKMEELADAYPSLPPVPLVSEKEFSLITDYFINSAPDSLVSPSRATPDTLTRFEAIPIQSKDLFPINSLVMRDSLNRIFVGGRKNTLARLDNNLVVKDKFLLDSPPSCIRAVKTDLWCLEMGIMDPNDKPFGKLVAMNLASRNTNVVLDSLKRPVHFEIADFNQDGLKDIVICEFGNYTGRLAVYELQNNGRYRRHILESVPGARKVIVRDLNGDQKPDILALFSQGNENISLYWNKGDFKFERQPLLAFPAVYGVSYFEIEDFNKDGHFDFLVTNGDNSDYSQILKPYHGVRIFLNDGKLNFTQSWFYPINGASWAAARDFDQDGDLDIAAISFFPDFSRTPPESFLYFENRQGSFIPQTTSHAHDGRWIVLETGDFDQDHDEDILLGALDFNPRNDKIFGQWKKHPVSLLFLKNKLH